MNCPECKNEVANTCKFCPYCAFSFEQYKKKRIKKFVIGFFVFLAFLFCAENIYNLIYEKRAVTPFSANLSFDEGVMVTIKGNYDKKSKTAFMELQTNIVVEQWQVEALNNTNLELTLRLHLDSSDKDFPAENIYFTAGEKISAQYILKNTNLEDYIKIKKNIMLAATSPGEVAIINTSGMGLNQKLKKELKRKYLAQKEEERRIKAQQEEIKRYLEQLRYSNYGYGYY